MMQKLIIFLSPLLTSCAGALGQVNAADPTERGLSYIAAAIVTAAIIQAFCNK